MDKRTVLEVFSDGKVLYRSNPDSEEEKHLKSNTEEQTHSLNKSRHEARKNVKVRYHTNHVKQVKEIKDTVYYFDD